MFEDNQLCHFDTSKAKYLSWNANWNSEGKQMQRNFKTTI